MDNLNTPPPSHCSSPDLPTPPVSVSPLAMLNIESSSSPIMITSSPMFTPPRSEGIPDVDACTDRPAKRVVSPLTVFNALKDPLNAVVTVATDQEGKRSTEAAVEVDGVQTDSTNDATVRYPI